MDSLYNPKILLSIYLRLQRYLILVRRVQDNFEGLVDYIHKVEIFFGELKRIILLFRQIEQVVNQIFSHPLRKNLFLYHLI